MNHIKKIAKSIIIFSLILFVNVFANLNALDTLTKVDGAIGFDGIPSPIIDYALSVNHASTGAIIVGEGTSEVVSFVIPYNFVAKGKCSENAIQRGHPTWKTNMQSYATDGNPRLHSEISLLQFLTGTEKPNRLSGILGEIRTKYPRKSIKILIKNSRLTPCRTADSFGPGIGCSEFIQNFRLQTGVNIDVQTK